MSLPKLPLRSLWPLPAALLLSAALTYARVLPAWALASVAFSAAGIATWSTARVVLRQRMAELAVARQRLEHDVTEIHRLEQARQELYAELLHSQKLEALGRAEFAADHGPI